jgi:hypothetical protein
MPLAQVGEHSQYGELLRARRGRVVQGEESGTVKQVGEQGEAQEDCARE